MSQDDILVGIFGLDSFLDEIDENRLDGSLSVDDAEDEIDSINGIDESVPLIWNDEGVID